MYKTNRLHLCLASEVYAFFREKKSLNSNSFYDFGTGCSFLWFACLFLDVYLTSFCETFTPNQIKWNEIHQMNNTQIIMASLHWLFLCAELILCPPNCFMDLIAELILAHSLLIYIRFDLEQIFIQEKEFQLKRDQLNQRFHNKWQVVDFILHAFGKSLHGILVHIVWSA